MAEKQADGVRLRGVLAIDGEVVARAERIGKAGNPAEQAPALVRDVLVRGDLIAKDRPLLRRPAFWVAVGVTAAVAAGVTAFFLVDRPVRTEIRF